MPVFLCVAMIKVATVAHMTPAWACHTYIFLHTYNIPACKSHSEDNQYF